jgi:hypothetical protein
MKAHWCVTSFSNENGRVVGLDLRRRDEATAPEGANAVLGREEKVRRAFEQVTVANAHVVVSGFVARRRQRVDAGEVHVMAAIDERRIASAAHQLRIEIHARDLVGARSCPPSPAELAPLQFECRSVRENRGEARALDPVRKIGE